MHGLCHIYHTMNQWTEQTSEENGETQDLAAQITQIPVLAKDSFSQE